MTVTYRTAGAWGAGKETNLSPAEVDENFWDHEQRIVDLETNAPTPNGIANILSDGTTMTIVLDDATEHDVTLPRPPQRPTETKAIATTTHTLALTDVMCFLRITNAAGCTITIPPESEVAFVVDTEIHIWLDNDEFAAVTVGATDITLHYPAGKAPDVTTRHGIATLKKVASDEWIIFGLLADEVTA